MVDEETGVLVPPETADSIATALELYIKNESQRRARCEAGRHRVEEFFSLNQMVENYLDMYDEILKTKAIRS